METEQKYFTNDEFKFLNDIQSVGIAQAKVNLLNNYYESARERNKDCNDRQIDLIVKALRKDFLSVTNSKFHSLAGKIIKPAGKE